jgi:hypothetical protein
MLAYLITATAAGRRYAEWGAEHADIHEHVEHAEP